MLPGQLAFATLNDGGGPGVMVRAAVLAVNADRLTILLTKATTKPTGVARQIIEIPQPLFACAGAAPTDRPGRGTSPALAAVEGAANARKP